MSALSVSSIALAAAGHNIVKGDFAIVSLLGTLGVMPIQLHNSSGCHTCE